MAGSKLGERWPRRGLAWAVGAVAAIVAVGAIDYQLTVDRLPEIGPSATPAADDDDLIERGEIQDGYQARIFVYGLAVLGIVAALVVAALRAAPAARRRDLFADLGAAGVALGLAVAYLEVREPNLLSDASSSLALWMTPIAMVLTAAVGSLSGWLRGEGEGPEHAGSRGPFSSMPKVAIGALVLTFLTYVAIALGHDGRQCGEPKPAGSDELIVAGAWLGIGAGVLGLVSLLKRRWVVALISVLGFLGGLLSAVISACLS